MELDKEKAVKLVIVLLVTIAALAVMSILVQIIQTVLPFLIVGAGIYAGYRWALSEAPAPTADEVEEQARGIFSRFRRSKKAVEATVKMGEALADFGGKPEAAAEAKVEEEAEQPDEKKVDKKHRRRRPLGTAAKDRSAKTEPAQAQPEVAELSDEQAQALQNEQVSQMKQGLGSNPKGDIEFRDRDVVINAKDIERPDISRLEDKEKEEPQVTSNVLAQIEERRRRLQGGE